MRRQIEEKKTDSEGTLKFRGHHNKNLQYLLADYLHARGKLTEVAAAHNSAQRLLDRLLAYVKIPYQCSNRDYGIDVIGENAEYAEVFLSGIVQAYIHFLRMPDDGILEFSTVPDSVCKFCAIGAHCKDPIQAEVDAIEIQHMIAVCQKKRIPYKILEKSALPNSRSESLRKPGPTKIALTKKAFRKLTAYKQSLWWVTE